VDFRLEDGGDVESWIPTGNVGLMSKFLVADGDKLITVMPLDDATFTFHLSQVKEIEKPRQLAQGMQNGWPSHDTNMLKLLSSWVDSTMQAMSQQQQEAGGLLTKFQEFRRTIEGDAVTAIDEQVAQLVHYRRSTVQPAHCECLAWFRELEGTAKVEQITASRATHFRYLEEYEEIHERYRKYLETRVTRMFQWSDTVREKIEKTDGNMADAMKHLRQETNDYWAALENTVTEEAMRQQREAEKKQRLAQEEQEKAAKEAEEAQKQAEEQRKHIEENMQRFRQETQQTFVVVELSGQEKEVADTAEEEARSQYTELQEKRRALLATGGKMEGETRELHEALEAQAKVAESAAKRAKAAEERLNEAGQQHSELLEQLTQFQQSCLDEENALKLRLQQAGRASDEAKKRIQDLELEVAGARKANQDLKDQLSAKAKE